MGKISWAWILLFVFVLGVSRASASVGCGDTLYNDTVLDSDLICTGNGLIIGSNNTILDCSGYSIIGSSVEYSRGVSFSNKQNVKIKNCNIENFYQGILLTSSSNNTLIGNTVKNNSNTGIYLKQYSNYNILNDNTVNFNLWGIVGGSFNQLNNNTINSNSFRGITPGLGNYLRNNNISFNSDAGIFLGPGGRVNTFFGNEINSNYYGIEITDSRLNIFNSNTITSNHLGIYIHSASDNLIYNNIFNNSYNAWNNGINSWNTNKTKESNIVGGPIIGGNFWHDYNGRDLNYDGIGDTNIPYNSNGNIQIGGDFYPLVEGKMRAIV